MDHENIIIEFCSITGVNKEIAQDALERSSWNLTDAVQSFMDESNDELLRQPMPQKYDKLVDEIIDPRPLYRRQQNNIAVNPFNGIKNCALPSTSRKRTLDALFNPPTDITCKMSFEMAKKQASSTNHYLLVDIQKASEFECCVLNRDVWPDNHIRELLRLHFVLWQVRSDSDDGLKFIQYYKVHLWPYIAILDPRTGENLLTINSCKLDDVTQSMESFLQLHQSLLVSPEQPSSKRRKQNEVSIYDLSEEDQLSSAIQESLKQNEKSNNNSILDNYENNSEVGEATNNFDMKYMSSLSLLYSNINSESISSIMAKQTLNETHLSDDLICHIVIRLRDGSRHDLKMPSNTKLKVLFEFVNSIVLKSHHIFLMWPKRLISFEDGEKTFSDADLFPNNIVYVEENYDS